MTGSFRCFAQISTLLAQHATCRHSSIGRTIIVKAIVKHAVHWKSLPLPALVLKLYDVVRGQYDDIRCALVGQGDCAVPIHTWASLSQEKKNIHYRRLLQQTATAYSKTVTSTDGKLMLTRPTNGGKKSGM